MKYFIVRTSHFKFIIAVIAIFGISDLVGQTGPGGVGIADGSSNLVLWLDADAEVGVNGVVSTSWNDQSGSGHNFTVGNGAVFNSNARNGVSTFGFDGASNYFETPFSAALNPAQFTIFSASNVNSSGSYKALISSRDGSPTAGYILYARPTTDNWDFWTGIGVSWGTVGNTTSTVGAWSSQTLSYQAGANGQQLYIDNQSNATGTFAMGQNVARPTRVGAGQNESTPNFYFNGDIGEVIVYNSVLNTAQRIIVNNYLSAKYNFANAANDLYTMDDSGNGDFDYGVVGIGRADASNTHTVAMSSKILQIQNASSLDVDGEYLFWGHDNADATAWTLTEAPYAGVNVQRIAREWRLNEVGGDVGTVDFVIDPASLPALPGGFSSYALLVDSDGDFSDATPYLMTLSGANYTVTGMNITDGDYVSVAAINPVIDHTLIASNGLESVTALTIQVFQNFIASTDISVSYATADGTALAAQPDYTAIGGTLTVPAGDTTTTYSLTVVDDAAIESNEDFTITLSAPSAGVNLGPNVTHTYTIYDNDNATKVFFSSALSNATEAFAGADIQVRLNIPAATIASVDYTIIGGTALGGGVDYTLASGTITFQAPSPNDFRQFIPVGIFDDLINEENETIIIRLSNPVNCNLDDGTLGFIEHTFTILDNDPDPTIQFNMTAFSGDESVSPANFQVDLSAISGADTDVAYTVTGGTAMGGGVDYTLLGSGVLTIPAGSLTGNISADIISDGIEEFDETIEITLSLPVNAVLGANTIHTYTITDNSANLGHLGPGGVGNVDGTSSLVLWLDANRETGGGGWSDQSGYGNDFTAGAGATFNAGARNGFSTFGFDGATNYFETAAYTATLNPGALTVFSASQVNSVDAYKALISSRDGSPTAGYILYSVPSGSNDDWSFWTGTGSGWGTIGNTTATVGAWSSQTFSYQSGVNGQQLFIDNNLDAQGTSTMGINSSWATRVGAGRNEGVADFLFDGDIGEVIMYDAVLNSVRRNIVNNYLAAKYNFALASNDLYTMDDSGNGDFDYEVAGIGRDNAGSFHIDAQGTGMVRVNGATDLGDGEYLLWGHDNGSFAMSNTTDIPGGINNRLNRIWRFDETGDVGSVSLSFDVSGFSINDSNELVLLVDSDDGLMVNSTEVAITSFAGGIATFNVNVTGGNWYTIASKTVDNILPVELISFSATVSNNTVSLDWKTASEIDNDFFSVERSSNGVDFFEIGQVEGNGTTNELQRYDYVDKSPLNGVSYYRLRQVDYDGAFEYSPVVSVNISLANFAFNVYPNPIENHRAIIEMRNVGEGDASIRVYNSVGKVVLNKTVALNSNQALKYDLAFERNIPTGIYIVEVRSGQNRYIRKVVIQ